MRKESYKEYTKKRAKKSASVKNCTLAFLVGGAICTFGQILYNILLSFGLEEKIVQITVPFILVFLACLFSGIGLFDRLAKYAGAGTLVPITGFANAMASPSIDNKAEGYVLGMGAKMFVIAGPVIVYGTISSVILGIILFVLKCFGIDIGYIE